MNERLKSLRLALNLNQAEFSERLGVSAPAISKVESGINALSDRLILSVCREYGIDEHWLRTGEGDMFISADNALIAQLTMQYGLDETDRKIIEIYIGLPRVHREALKNFALKLLDVARDADLEKADDEYRAEWNDWSKGLTEDEAVGLLRKRFADAKKGVRQSMTSGNTG